MDCKHKRAEKCEVIKEYMRRSFRELLGKDYDGDAECHKIDVNGQCLYDVMDEVDKSGKYKHKFMVRL